MEAICRSAAPSQFRVLLEARNDSSLTALPHRNKIILTALRSGESPRHAWKLGCRTQRQLSNMAGMPTALCSLNNQIETSRQERDPVRDVPEQQRRGRPVLKEAGWEKRVSSGVAFPNAGHEENEGADGGQGD